MGAPPGSQVVPLPQNLPFRLVSKTIGSGAYASIRKAIPLNKPSPVIAIKFINKDHAFRTGRLRPKQIQLELAIHHRVSGHPNIIQYLQHGDENEWVWIAMELAEGGDLFDKIEADEGVTEDIAHLYFSQLVAAIRWCHGKGVAHRDIKPENMLLSGSGDLKLADFGLATQFMEPKTGKRKVCGLVCGSPPYIAPEILEIGVANNKRKSAEEEKQGYDPQIADVWSCAIVLFVLFAGNTPWDSPVAAESWEYNEFVKTNGNPADELWEKIPAAALSLITGMLKVNLIERMSLSDVQQHPWFSRANSQLNKDGRAVDPVQLATQLMERLHINFSQEVPASQNLMAMDVDIVQIDDSRTHPGWTKFSSTQPDTPTTDLNFDWEQPPRFGGGISASQPMHGEGFEQQIDHNILERLTQDPSMSQFSSKPTIPLSLTQAAQRFNDIAPAHAMTRFVSALPLSQLVSVLTSALHRMCIPVSPMQGLAYNTADRQVAIRVKTLDGRRQPLHGNIVIESNGDNTHEVRFIKGKGDPIGWRRLFKHAAILCQEAILKPLEEERNEQHD